MRTVLLVSVLTLGACESPSESLNEPAPIVAHSPLEAASGDVQNDSTTHMPTSLATDESMEVAEVLAEGTFSGRNGHDARGRTLLIRLTDGTLVVRLEGLDVDNGPDLRVHLIRNLVDDTSPPIDLGALKSTRGDQNYTLPADADLSPDSPLGVSIWCRAFSIGFGTAALE